MCVETGDESGVKRTGRDEKSDCRGARWERERDREMAATEENWSYLFKQKWCSWESASQNSAWKAMRYPQESKNNHAKSCCCCCCSSLLISLDLNITGSLSTAANRKFQNLLTQCTRTGNRIDNFSATAKSAWLRFYLMHQLVFVVVVVVVRLFCVSVIVLLHLQVLGKRRTVYAKQE